MNLSSSDGISAPSLLMIFLPEYIVSSHFVVIQISCKPDISLRRFNLYGLYGGSNTSPLYCRSSLVNSLLLISYSFNMLLITLSFKCWLVTILTIISFSFFSIEFSFFVDTILHEVKLYYPLCHRELIHHWQLLYPLEISLLVF